MSTECLLCATVVSDLYTSYVMKKMKLIDMKQSPADAHVQELACKSRYLCF